MAVMRKFWWVYAYTVLVYILQILSISIQVNCDSSDEVTDHSEGDVEQSPDTEEIGLVILPLFISVFQLYLFWNS